MHIAFLLYILAYGVTKMVNSGLYQGLDKLFSCFTDYFVFIWLAVFINDSNKQKLRIALFFSGILAVGYGLMQAIGLDLFHRQVNPLRLSGFHKNAYTYGGQLIIFFFLFLGVWYQTWKKLFRERKDILRSIIYFCGLIATFFCILNTSERAVIFGVIIGLFVFFLINVLIYKFKLEDISPFVVLFCFPLIVTSIFNKTVIKRIKRVFFPKKGKRGKKLNPRFRLWDIAIISWKKNLLFGSGEYPIVYNKVSEHMHVQVLTHAHSLYLQILVIHGLIGILAFINLMGAIFVKLFQSIKSNQFSLSLIAALVAFLVEGIFEYNWGDSEVRLLLLYVLGFVFANNTKYDN